INVVGANDTPVATGTYTHTVTDTAAVSKNARLNWRLAESDCDTGDTLTWSGSGVGTYGTLTVNSDGTYSYAVNAAAVNALQNGDTPCDSFTATVTYTLSLHDALPISINVVGANDTPVATGTYTHTVTDTAALNTYGALTGTLAASDRDTGDTLTWSGSGVGTYGTLTVNSDGTYSYAVNAAAVNALQNGDTPSDSFTVTVTDALGLTDTRTVAINVV